MLNNHIKPDAATEELILIMFTTTPLTTGSGTSYATPLYLRAVLLVFCKQFLPIQNRETIKIN